MRNWNTDREQAGRQAYAGRCAGRWAGGSRAHIDTDTSRACWDMSTAPSSGLSADYCTRPRLQHPASRYISTSQLSTQLNSSSPHVLQPKRVVRLSLSPLSSLLTFTFDLPTSQLVSEFSVKRGFQPNATHASRAWRATQAQCGLLAMRMLRLIGNGLLDYAEYFGQFVLQLRQ